MRRNATRKGTRRTNADLNVNWQQDGQIKCPQEERKCRAMAVEWRQKVRGRCLQGAAGDVRAADTTPGEKT